MSGSYRGPRLASLALILAAGFFLIFIPVASHVQYQPHGQIAGASDQTENADDEPERNDPAPPWPINWVVSSYQDNLAQWLMVIFAAGAFGVSIYAVRVLRRTLEATNEAVRSADEAVEVARQMGQIQVRAYVAFGNTRVENFDVGLQPVVLLKIKNVGQSPAIQLQIVTRFAVADNPHSEKLFFNGPKWNGPALDLLPGGDSSQKTELPPLDGDLYTSFMNEEAYLMFFGMARYRTVFGKPCRITFCTYLRPSDLEGGSAQLIPTKRHNRSS
ncbi:hypothetical protein [Roseitalea porphyridii]|jgi:hypothetical protein|uniref:hypothetical protein n=1 Tax=Roseitalea porphyridii TaxID=1852022 RepID=UPI0032EF6BE4